MIQVCFTKFHETVYVVNYFVFVCDDFNSK